MENIWLPQKRIAELFDVDRSVVTKHLRNIFSSNELEEDSVCANFAHTAEDGKDYQTKFYEVALALANKEYEAFKKKQDKNFISDFDKEVKRLTGKKDDEH